MDIKNYELTDEIKNKKNARHSAICWTIFYIFVFPFSFFFAGMSFMIFDSPISMLVGTIIVSIFFLTPLSILVTICLIWLYYFCKQYKKVYKCKYIPFFVFFGSFLILSLEDIIKSFIYRPF